MKILERKLEHQVQFWSLLGPFVILLAIAILLFKVSSHWYFPLTALVGIPLCLKWKLKGLATALTFLTVIMFSSYPTWELDERYWHVGMGMAMALSFVVLALSLEEADGLVGNLQRESQSRLDNFLRLDEKMKIVEQEWSTEKETLKVQVQILSKDLAGLQEEKQNFQKLIQLSKDELLTLRSQYERLVEDLSQKKQYISQLKERIDESEMTVQDLVNTDSVQKLKQMAATLADYEQQVEDLKNQRAWDDNELKKALEFSQQQEQEKMDQKAFMQSKEEQIKELEKEKALLTNSLSQLQQSLTHAKQAEHDLQAQKALMQGKEEQIRSLEKEKTLLTASLSQLQQSLSYAQQSEQEHRAQKALIQEKEEQIRSLEKEKALLIASLSQLQQQSEAITTLEKRQKEELLQKADEMRELQTTFADMEQRLFEIQEEKREVEVVFTQQENKLKNEKEEALRQLKETIELMDQKRDEQAQKAEKEEAKILLLAQQCQELEQEKGQMEQELNQLRVQIDQYQQLLDKAQKNQEKFSYGSGNTRQIESMYLQLKSQFQEKSLVLDVTRRELFHVQEQLLGLQKDAEEKEQFEWDEREKLWQKEVHRLTKEFENTEREANWELDHLHKLVESLLRQGISYG